MESESLTIAAPVDTTGDRYLNFAIARVRLTSSIQGGGAIAPNVRVFFRLWVSMSPDCDFDPNTTYVSVQPYPELPQTPTRSDSKLPYDPMVNSLRTLPQFATDTSAYNEYRPGACNNNIRDLEDGMWAYFGCFLGVNPQIGQWMFPGTHHCLVAQIAYDGDPLLYSPGMATTPGETDKIALRNMSIATTRVVVQDITADDTSSASTPIMRQHAHSLPTPFDTRPSPSPTFGLNESIINTPDLLMIDWGTNLPEGTRAQVFWPAATAADVIELSTRIYGSNFLTAVDDHTVSFDAMPGAVTYVPIPAIQKVVDNENVEDTQNQGDGTTSRLSLYAGLFTMDMPAGLPLNDTLDVLVRRVSTQKPAESEIPSWPAVSGGFQVRIRGAESQNSSVRQCTTR